MKWYGPLILVWLLLGTQSAFGKAGHPTFISGRYHLRYELEPTEAFHEMIKEYREAMDRSVQTELEAEHLTEEEKTSMRKSLVMFLELAVARWNQKLHFDMRGELGRDEKPEAVLVFAEEEGNRSAIFRIVGLAGGVFGYRNYIHRTFMEANHIETLQLKGRFDLKSPGLVTGTVTWVVDGKVYGKGPFHLERIPSQRERDDVHRIFGSPIPDEEDPKRKEAGQSNEKPGVGWRKETE